MAFNFRYARPEDVDSIVQIEAAAISNPWTAASYIEAINSNHAFVIAALEDDVLVGHAVFYLTPPEAELPDIVIAKPHRKQGLGRMLLEHSLEELKRYDVNTLYLEVRISNTAALTLYNRMGFEEIGKRKYFYTNPVEDAICMRKHLGTERALYDC